MIIHGQAAGFDCRLVEITGGEPLLQKNTASLISCLVEKGYMPAAIHGQNTDIQVVQDQL